MNLEVLTTADGSSTLFRSDLNETYHSRRGAWTESEYVYLAQGLQQRQEHHIHVLEFGFGTGMNALLSFEYARDQGRKVMYYTSEMFPVPSEITRQILLPGKEERESLFNRLHDYAWNTLHLPEDFFSFYKHEGDFRATPCAENSIDVIFYDAFAPSRQPDAWEPEQLIFAHKVLKPGGILVTYCAQGQFKRNLKSLGFVLEKLPGALGKGEMTRATKA